MELPFFFSNFTVISFKVSYIYKTHRNFAVFTKISILKVISNKDKKACLKASIIGEYLPCHVNITKYLIEQRDTKYTVEF